MATATENISGISQPSPRQSSRHTQTIHSVRPAAAEPRGKMGRQPPSKALENPLQGLFIYKSAHVHDMFCNCAADKKPLQIPLNFKVSAQKVSDPESAGQIRPNAFKFPQSPLFSAISRFRTYLLIPIDCRPARRRKPVPCRAPQWRRLQLCPQK